VPQTYLVRGPGGGFESAEFPWTTELLADLRAARCPGRSPAVIHRLGDALRTFLTSAGWTHHEHEIVRSARDGAPIFITIRSAAAELYALPWEFVALKATGQLLGGVPGLLIRYEWPEADTSPDRVNASSRCSRVLLAWSAAAGAVPAAEHLAALQEALGGSPGAFDTTRDVLAHATFGAVSRALALAAREGPPIDVLHLLCHGAAVGGSFGLALDDESQPGAGVAVDAGRMQQLLAPYVGMVRMVVLAACDSGNSGQLDNHLGSVAQMLHRAGIQAVVGSRFPLSISGSTRFVRSFYRALARDRASMEGAFLAAREALLDDPSQLDWASVQLYSRDASGDATYPLHFESGAISMTIPVSSPTLVTPPSPAPELPPATVRLPAPVVAPELPHKVAGAGSTQQPRTLARRRLHLVLGVCAATLGAVAYSLLPGREPTYDVAAPEPGVEPTAAPPGTSGGGPTPVAVKQPIEIDDPDIELKPSESTPVPSPTPVAPGPVPPEVRRNRAPARTTKNGDKSQVSKPGAPPTPPVEAPSPDEHVYPATCADLKLADPAASDGTHTLYVKGDSNRPWKAHCHNMAASAREYLTLPRQGTDINIGRFANNSGVTTTHYKKVRISPLTLEVDTGDIAFATKSGSVDKGDEKITHVAYGAAMTCDRISTSVTIDLRDTPFHVDDNFCTGGASTSGSTDSTPPQVYTNTGGGDCGWRAPATGGCPYNPYNGAGNRLRLIYARP